jgi:hypothetical protein
MRRIPMPGVTPVLAMLMAVTGATAADQKSVLEQKLAAKYRISTVNAEGELVIAGATLELRVSGLIAGSNAACVDDYKDGKFTLGGNLLQKANCAHIGGTQVGTAKMRSFVAGEKLYVTKIEVKDAISFHLISDPVSNLRYKAEVRFPKAGSLDLGPAQQMIAGVLGIGEGGAAPDQPAISSAPNSPPAAAAPAATAFAPIPAPAPPPKDTFAPIPAPAAPPKETSLVPIPPPPPPSDQPAQAQSTISPGAISPGMTIDQVVAQLGQPNKIADLGSKKVYSYKTVKVTFIDGKVAPVPDSSTALAQTADLLPYEIGLGVLILAAAAFLLARRRKPARLAPPPPPPPPAMPPVPPPLPPAAQPAPPQAQTPPMNPIQRLDELEKMMAVGILSREEFEKEKDKLRSM